MRPSPCTFSKSDRRHASVELGTRRLALPTCHAGVVGVVFQLFSSQGKQVTLPDPSSGTFDAAGDFDGVLRWTDDPLEVLGRVDPYDDVEFSTVDGEGMVSDIDVLLQRHAERNGPTPRGDRASARRGLLRLREMAAYLGSHPGSTIKAIGD